MNIIKKTTGTLLCAASLAVACSTNAATRAASYPDKPVRLVVPFTAGGVADTLARLVAQSLSEQWKQPVVVENKAGAGGNIGMSMVAKAAPDGYTLALAPVGNMTVNYLLYTQLDYQASDFAPITELAASPNVLVAGKKKPVKNVQEFIDYAKANPNLVDFSSPGVGSGAHLAGELLNQMAGLQMVHVPYSGIAPAINDVIAGNVSIVFGGISTVLPFIRDGKLQALAIAGPDRLQELPEVPTLIEAGYEGFNITSWYGLVTRAGTPDEIIDKIQKAVAKGMDNKAFTEKLASFGLIKQASTPSAFAQQIATDTKNWGEIIKKAGIKPVQ